MKNKKVWIILIALLGISLAAGSVYLLLRPQPSEPEKPPIEEQPPVESEEEKKLKEKITYYQLEEYQTLILDNKELFNKYLETVENNEKIESFKLYVMNVFPIIASYQKYLEEDVLWEGLSKLNIHVEPNLKCGTVSANGCYRDNLKQVAVNRWEEDSMHSADIIVLYHELMHFLDWNMNSFRNNHAINTYFCNQQIYTFDEYNELSEEEKTTCSYARNNILRLITEGGAETWMARYFNNGITVTYGNYTDRFEILNFLIGFDEMNEMFFVSNHTAKIYETLVVKHSVSTDLYNKLINYLLMDNLTNENRVYFIDTCIKIYEQMYQKKWFQDKIFSYFMLNYIRDFIPINYLYNSPNIQAYKEYYYTNYLNINHSITETIENGKYSPYSQPALRCLNGEYKLMLYVEYKEQHKNKYGRLIVDYDFDNKKIINYQFIPDPETTPVNP